VLTPSCVIRRALTRLDLRTAGHTPDLVVATYMQVNSLSSDLLTPNTGFVALASSPSGVVILSGARSPSSPDDAVRPRTASRMPRVAHLAFVTLCKLDSQVVISGPIAQTLDKDTSSL